LLAGLSVLIRALQDNYNDLDGTLLEGIARLFRENVRLNVFPIPATSMKDLESWKWKEANGLVGVRDIEPPAPLNHLYHYLPGSGFIQPGELPDT
jgi:hypothetical protein